MTLSLSSHYCDQGSPNLLVQWPQCHLVSRLQNAEGQGLVGCTNTLPSPLLLVIACGIQCTALASCMAQHGRATMIQCDFVDKWPLWQEQLRLDLKWPGSGPHLRTRFLAHVRTRKEASPEHAFLVSRAHAQDAFLVSRAHAHEFVGWVGGAVNVHLRYTSPPLRSTKPFSPF